MRQPLSPIAIQQTLGLSDEAMVWLQGVERPAASPGPMLPDDVEAAMLLERLGVKPDDRRDALAARLDPDIHPALWWVLDRAYHDMLANMGVGEPTEGFAGWPDIPSGTGALGRHLYVWLFLAVLPEVRRFQTARGIPDDIAWETLSVLGRAMDTHRSINGVSGLGLWRQWGLPVVFRGIDYQLGRLGFNFGVLSFLGRAYTHVLNMHVPPFGCVDAAACDASLAQAREFFPRHFPDMLVSMFLCHSWLMDDQLAAYLPASSNLMQFQRRFELVKEVNPSISDGVILNYVFRQGNDDPEISTAVLDDLPQTTTLQRAYVTHLRAGKHWHARTGWLAF